MKIRFVTLLIAAAAAIMPAVKASAAEPAPLTMQEVHDFIKSAGYYFLATVEGDQPRVRPFGTILIYRGRLYVQTGKKKNVSKQLAANGKVELCAFNGKEWLRLSGTLVNDESIEAKKAMLDAHPSLKSLYRAEDPNTQVLYFKDAVAVISSFTAPPRTGKF